MAEFGDAEEDFAKERVGELEPLENVLDDAAGRGTDRGDRGDRGGRGGRGRRPRR